MARTRRAPWEKECPMIPDYSARPAGIGGPNDRCPVRLRYGRGMTEATFDATSASGFRRFLASRQALWCGFTIIHLLLASLCFAGPGNPLGDVTDVYRSWALQAQTGLSRMGIDTPWVYPILAFAPMTVALLFGPVLYGATWLVLVTLLNGIVFSILLGSGSLSRRRRIAAWWWILFLVLLGPVALGRIDTVTVPVAILGLLWAGSRPRLATALLTVAMWMKVWAGGVIGALAVSSRRRLNVFVVTASLSAAILVISLLAGAGMNAIGFVAEQAGRGLQVESPFAIFWLWQIVVGHQDVGVRYSFDILTFQLWGPGVETAATLATPLMVVLSVTIIGLGIRATRSGASFLALFPPLALCLVVTLMLSNKVGSPQFVSWLAAPIILGLVVSTRRYLTPAILTGGIALCTQVIYPYWYRWLLSAQPVFVFVLTLKIVLLVGLLGWGIGSVWQAGTRAAVRHRNALALVS